MVGPDFKLVHPSQYESLLPGQHVKVTVGLNKQFFTEYTDDYFFSLQRMCLVNGAHEEMSSDLKARENMLNMLARLD